MNFMMGCQLNGMNGEDDEEREHKEEMDKVLEGRRKRQTLKGGGGVDKIWNIIHGKVQLKSNYSHIQDTGGFF